MPVELIFVLVEAIVVPVGSILGPVGYVAARAAQTMSSFMYVCHVAKPHV